jgi:hypothetical protein
VGRSRTLDPVALQQGLARAGFNRNNDFGGLWSPQNSHPGWNTNRIHCWHRHFFVFLDGGWLDFDEFWPDPYYLEDYDYHPDYGVGTDQLVMDVQAALQDLGYYNGPINGVLDVNTSVAISDYQNDAGLVSNGFITGALLDCLGLR